MGFEGKMIRKYKDNDLETVLKIWLDEHTRHPEYSMSSANDV